MSLPKVKLVDPFVPLFSLIPNSLGVASINSTCGFEALIFNKPVLYASFNAFYSELPYTFSFQKPKQIRDFISLVDHPENVDTTVCSNAIIIFIAHVFSTSFRLPMSLLWMPFSKSRFLTPQQLNVAYLLASHISAR